MALCDWLLSVSMMFSRFVYAVACFRASFLLMAEYYYVVWIYHILLIHASVDGHLDCFHLLAVTIDAAINICVQVFL